MKKKIEIKILEPAKDQIFHLRENNTRHTSYQREQEFYSHIQKGDLAWLTAAYEKNALPELVVGRLSQNPLRQMQYWAICCITLAVRYAMQGGLDEMMAYSLSDKYILSIDGMTDVIDIQIFLEESIFAIARMVQKRNKGALPTKIRACLEYISNHLHNDIYLADLAGVTNLSQDYLSKYFKKYVGISVSEYIANEKLEASKEMLSNGISSKQVAYNLNFCSQTYFSTCFKKRYGITPSRFAQTY